MSYNETAHEYILKEYFARYSFDHYKVVLEQNEGIFVIDGKFSAKLATEFIIENLHLFTDSLLYDTVVKEAIQKFTIINSDDYTNPFTEEGKKILLDYKNEYSGINALQFDPKDNFSMLNSYATSNIGYLNEYEMENYTILFNMIETKSSLTSIIEFLEESKNDPNFTPKYVNIIDFSINASKFYEEEGENLYSIIGGYKWFMACWGIGFAIGWDIGGLTHGDNVGGAVFGSVTQTSVIVFNEALHQYIDSFPSEPD